MNAERSTHAVIKTAVSSLEHVLDNQTNQTLTELQGITKLNTTAAQRYTGMNEAIQGLATDQAFMQRNHDEITRYVEQIDSVASDVARLEHLVRQMNEWSKELAVKVKRL